MKLYMIVSDWRHRKIGKQLFVNLIIMYSLKSKVNRTQRNFVHIYTSSFIYQAIIVSCGVAHATAAVNHCSCILELFLFLHCCCRHGCWNSSWREGAMLNLCSPDCCWCDVLQPLVLCWFSCCWSCSSPCCCCGSRACSWAPEGAVLPHCCQW